MSNGWFAVAGGAVLPAGAAEVTPPMLPPFLFVPPPLGTPKVNWLLDAEILASKPPGAAGDELKPSLVFPAVAVSGAVPPGFGISHDAHLLSSRAFLTRHAAHFHSPGLVNLLISNGAFTVAGAAGADADAVPKDDGATGSSSVTTHAPAGLASPPAKKRRRRLRRRDPIATSNKSVGSGLRLCLPCLINSEEGLRFAGKEGENLNLSGLALALSVANVTSALERWARMSLLSDTTSFTSSCWRDHNKSTNEQAQIEMVQGTDSKGVETLLSSGMGASTSATAHVIHSR